MNLKIKNFSKINGCVKAPSSKSYSHRAVILASLAEGSSRLYDVLFSEDVLASIRACKALGARITEKEDEKGRSYLEVIGTGGNLHNNMGETDCLNGESDCSKSGTSPKEAIDLSNSGTTLRIMTSVAALSDNEVIFTGDDSLKTRPMAPLLDALEPLGIETESLLNNNRAPIMIKPGYIGGKTDILGSISSQFISSILISAPLSKKGVKLEVYPQFVSKPYVDMTLSIMNTFGVVVEEEETRLHEVCTGCGQICYGIDFTVCPQKYWACDYVVEGDYSSASYLLSAVAIAGGEIRIQNLFKDSKQGDKLIIEILQDMGVDIEIFDDYLIVKSDGKLNAIDELNLEDAPDLLLTVAILAACAKGDTKITGVHHARLKETDRIDTTCRELEKLGCFLEENEDGMIIRGETIHDGVVESHNDHRLAMAFSLLGLRWDVEVENGECFDVSFPDFIESMAQIGINLELV